MVYTPAIESPSISFVSNNIELINAREKKRNPIMYVKTEGLTPPIMRGRIVGGMNQANPMIRFLIKGISFNRLNRKFLGVMGKLYRIPEKSGIMEISNELIPYMAAKTNVTKKATILALNKKFPFF